MTFTVTSITKSQWYKVVRVIFWLVLSSLLALFTAWVTKNKNWLASMPIYNVVLVAITQLFQNEEAQAQPAIPAEEDKAITDSVDKIISPSVESAAEENISSDEPQIPASPQTPAAG